MAGIFANILMDEGVVRDRAINFLSVKVKLLLAEDLLTKDIEEVFIQHCKKVCNYSAKVHSCDKTVHFVERVITIFSGLQPLLSMRRCDAKMAVFVTLIYWTHYTYQW